MERVIPGFATDAKIPKMGMRASTMCEIQLDDCEVPEDNVLGTLGGGVKNMMRNLEIERLTLAAMSLGIADRCLDVMTRYAARQPLASANPSRSTDRSSATYIGESYAQDGGHARAHLHAWRAASAPAGATAWGPTR